MSCIKLGLIFTLIILYGCSSSRFKVMSSEIDKKYRQDKKPVSVSFDNARMKLYHHQKEKLQRLITADTIFFLEEYILEEGAFVGSIWSMRDSVSFKYTKGAIRLIDNPFTMQTRNLVKKWDIKSIREHEIQYSEMIPSQWIYGTRVTKIKDIGFVVDTVSFVKFINLDLDR